MGLREGLRAGQAAATRLALVTAARRLFTERGYHGTGTHDVVALAGVTRGALYHHFLDKEALFLAVFLEVETDLVTAAGEPVLALALDPWSHLQTGIQSFLTVVAAMPDVQRVLLIDGPAVLGWMKWRELQSEFSFGHITEGLEKAMRDGAIRTRPVGPIAHLVFACLHEAALMIANSPAPADTRIEAGEALATMLDGLK